MSSFSDRLLVHLVPPLAHVYLRVLRRTMRIGYRNRDVLHACRREPGHYILAFWHSRFLMMPYAHPEGRMTVMLSRHRDAEVLARTLGGFGLKFVRGSTTRGGKSALRELVRRIGAGSDAGIAPDGPRGPRRRLQEGVLAVARFSGLPIVPVAFSAHPARRLRSWDRTLVPRPFSRGLFLYGEPIRVSRRADRAEQSQVARRLQEVLDRLTDEADRETGIGPEDAAAAGGPP